MERTNSVCALSFSTFLSNEFGKIEMQCRATALKQTILWLRRVFTGPGGHCGLWPRLRKIDCLPLPFNPISSLSTHSTSTRLTSCSLFAPSALFAPSWVNSHTPTHITFITFITINNFSQTASVLDRPDTDAHFPLSTQKDKSRDGSNLYGIERYPSTQPHHHLSGFDHHGYPARLSFSLATVVCILLFNTDQTHPSDPIESSHHTHSWTS